MPNFTLNGIIKTLKEGTVGITYDDIFQECCSDSVRTVVVYDSYVIHGDYQMENFRNFCNMLKRLCLSLKKIELHTKRPDDAAETPTLRVTPVSKSNAANTTSPGDKRKNFLDDLRRLLAITLDVAEYDHKKAPLHGRYTRFLDEQGDGWQVLSDMGLDIFNRPVPGRRGERKREKVATCRNTHFAMFRPGTDVLFQPEPSGQVFGLESGRSVRSGESSAISLTTSMLASLRLSPGGRSFGYFAKKTEQAPSTSASSTS